VARVIVVDASVLIAHFNAGDNQHSQAEAALSGPRGPMGQGCVKITRCVNSSRQVAGAGDCRVMAWGGAVAAPAPLQDRRL